jgi:signal transduction histidine kinase
LSDIDQRVKQLSSRSPFERQKAATWFVANTEEGNSSFLASAVQRESVPSIRRLLLHALVNRQATTDPLADVVLLDDARIDRTVGAFQSRLTSADVSSMVWHELSPPIGWLASSLREESETYESGAPWRALQSLERRLEGLVALLKLEEPLSLSRVRLADALAEAWPNVDRVPDVRWEAGTDTTEVLTDRGLLNTVLANLLQNAEDAAPSGTPVVVRVGALGERFWLRISNHFHGLSFETTDGGPAVSTKSIQRGRGTGYIFLAARRLGLEVTIRGDSGVAVASLTGLLSSNSMGE